MVFYSQGAKRKAISGYQSHDDSSDNSECSFPFKYTYGVNAWKHWVKTRQLDEDRSAKIWSSLDLLPKVNSNTITNLKPGHPQLTKVTARERLG